MPSCLKYRGRFFMESGVILRMGLPLAGAQLAQISMSFTDTVMAGNYHPDDLASVAVGSSLFMPPFIIVVGILMALSPIIAQHHGAGQHRYIPSRVHHGLALGILLAVPVMILLNNMHPLMQALGFSPQVANITSGYLFAVSWGMPAVFAYMVLRFYHEALGRTRPAFYVTLVGLCFNILGNYTLIYGRFGFPELGAVGTGWATAIVFWVMFLVMLAYSRIKSPELFQGLSLSFRKFDILSTKEILRIGIPIGISMGMETSMFAVVALIMGMLGTTVVAGHQIAINVASVTFMIPLGLSMAITIRVGHLQGKKQWKDSRFAGFTGIAICTAIMLVAAGFMTAFPQQIASLYTRDPEVVRMASSLLIMAAIFQVSDGLQVSGSGALRGLKDTRIPMLVNLTAYWVVGIPLGYLLGITLDWGPQGLWAGVIAGLSVAAVLHNLRFFLLSMQTHQK